MMRVEAQDDDRQRERVADDNDMRDKSGQRTVARQRRASGSVARAGGGY